MQRTAKVGLYGLVLAGLLGGSAAWANNGKSFDLRVDGRDQTVHADASNVQGVLKAAGIEVGAHDIVAPDVSSPVGDGAKIVVRRGHLLHLTVDGHGRDVWVNADSVAEALGQLGFNERSFVSVSRSKRLDTSATDLVINSPKKITIRVDHKSIPVISAGPTVFQAIAEAGIHLGRADRVKPTGALKNNEIVIIQRLSYGTSVVNVSVPFKTVNTPDPSNYVGTNTLAQGGRNGTNRVTYKVVYVDGKFAGKVAIRTVPVSRPQIQIKKVGSRQAPAFISSVPAGSPQQIAAGMVAARGWGADQFSCLVSLWNKESGWRVDAANPSGAYGIPQSLPGEKMSAAGSDWQTNPATQITWGLGYIAGVYGTPCAAWGHSQATNWY